MRNSVKYIFLWFCFFNCSSVKLKAEGITDYEKQWKILGPVNFIDSLSGAYQFSQLDKELFFLENYQVLEMNRKEFWSAVKHKSELNFTQSLLGNHRKQYTDMFGKYIVERNSKSVEFTKLQDQFHILTTSTSSGFGIDTLNSICTNPNFEDAGSFHFKGWNAWAGNACYYTNNYSCNNFST